MLHTILFTMSWLKYILFGSDLFGELGGLIKYIEICSFIFKLKGNGTNIIRIIPYTAVQFAAYEEFKKVSKKM